MKGLEQTMLSLSYIFSKNIFDIAFKEQLSHLLFPEKDFGPSITVLFIITCLIKDFFFSFFPHQKTFNYDFVTEIAFGLYTLWNNFIKIEYPGSFYNQLKNL